MGSGGSKPLLCRSDELLCGRKRTRRKNNGGNNNKNGNDDEHPSDPDNDPIGASSSYSALDNVPVATVTNGKNNHKNSTSGRSFHEGLVRERDRMVDFEDIYQVLNEIGNGGLCKIYRVQKYEDKIGGSSRPEGVRRRKYYRGGYHYGGNHSHHNNSNHNIGGLKRNASVGAFYSSYATNKSPTKDAATGTSLPRPLSYPSLALPRSEESSNGSNNPILPKIEALSERSSSESVAAIPRSEHSLADSNNGSIVGTPKKEALSSSGRSSSESVGISRPEPLRDRAKTEPADPSSLAQRTLPNTPGDENGGGFIGAFAPPATKGPDMVFALKVINLALVDRDKVDQLKNEVEILKTLDHKNIIKAYETFQMRKHKKLMIVMELCTGGDMHARMPYTERQVANVMRQVLSAISYMHSKRIIHRDIKLENILWESKHPEAVVKVIDFGLSKFFSPNNNVLTERVGTLYSMSPETMKGIYTTQADLWSIGVCTYIMLSMNRPFDGQTPKQLVANVLQCKYEFSTPPEMQQTGTDVWTSISDHAKSFIAQLLVLEPMDRLTADTAKNHEWFKVSLQRRGWHKTTSGDESTLTVGSKHGQLSTHALENDQDVGAQLHPEDTIDDDPDLPSRVTEEFKNKVRANIVQYADMGEFRRLALNVVAKKSTSSEIFELRKVFDEFDTLNTGTITLEEFKAALAQFEYSEKEIMKIFRKVDVNKNNVINYTEFLAATLEAKGAIEEYRLAEAFDVLDSDDSGYISRDNLRRMLGDRGKDERYIDKLIAEADIKKDGRISYEEFLQVFNRTSHAAIHDIYKGAGSLEQENAADEVLQLHGIAVVPSDDQCSSQREQRPTTPRSSGSVVDERALLPKENKVMRVVDAQGRLSEEPSKFSDAAAVQVPSKSGSDRDATEQFSPQDQQEVEESDDTGSGYCFFPFPRMNGKRASKKDALIPAPAAGQTETGTISTADRVASPSPEEPNAIGQSNTGKSLGNGIF